MCAEVTDLPASHAHTRAVHVKLIGSAKEQACAVAPGGDAEGRAPAQVSEGLNDTAESFLAAIERGEAEIAPSSLYAAAAVLEGVAFINGSPQNTFVPGLIDLAVQKGAYILELLLSRCALRRLRACAGSGSVSRHSHLRQPYQNCNIHTAHASLRRLHNLD